MNTPENSPIDVAYEAAVVAVLNACPDSTEEEAEKVIDSIANLIFTTMRAYLEEKLHESASSH